MYTRKLVLFRVDSGEPFFEECTRRTGFVLLHNVECSSRVIQNGIDENLKVGKAEGASLSVLQMVYGGSNDGLNDLGHY